jgi:hypothetical protein
MYVMKWTHLWPWGPSFDGDPMFRRAFDEAREAALRWPGVGEGPFAAGAVAGAADPLLTAVDINM